MPHSVKACGLALLQNEPPKLPVAALVHEGVEHGGGALGANGVLALRSTSTGEQGLKVVQEAEHRLEDLTKGEEVQGTPHTVQLQGWPVLMKKCHSQHVGRPCKGSAVQSTLFRAAATLGFQGFQEQQWQKLRQTMMCLPDLAILCLAKYRQLMSR